MESYHIIAIHIYSVAVHDQTDDMYTFKPLPYQMFWHKHNVHVALLYFYMFRI